MLAFNIRALGVKRRENQIKLLLMLLNFWTNELVVFVCLWQGKL